MKEELAHLPRKKPIKHINETSGIQNQSNKDIKKMIYIRVKNKWQNECLKMNIKLNEIKIATQKFNN